MARGCYTGAEHRTGPDFHRLSRLGGEAAAFANCIAMASGSVVILLLFTGKRMDLFYTTANIYGRKSLCFLANGSSEFFSNISMSAMSIVPMLLFSDTVEQQRSPLFRWLCLWTALWGCSFSTCVIHSSLPSALLWWLIGKEKEISQDLAESCISLFSLHSVYGVRWPFCGITAAITTDKAGNPRPRSMCLTRPSPRLRRLTSL